MNRLLFLLLTMFLGFTRLSAQEFKLRKLRSEQNLSSDHVQAIFNVYLKDKGVFVEDFDAIKNRYKLKSKEISKVFVDSQDRFWFLHPYDGLSIYNRSKDESLYLISKSTLEGSLSHNNVTDIQEDPTGNFWRVYDNGTIDILSGNSLKVIHHVSIDEIVGLNQNYNLKLKPDLDNLAGLKNSNVWNIFEDSKNRLWIGTLREGLFWLDRENKSFVQYTESGGGLPLNNLYITGIAEEDNANIWVAGINGIDVFNPEIGYQKHYPGNSQDSSGLSSNEVSDLIKDKHGIIWVSTNKGLCYFDEQTFCFIVFNQSNGLKNEFLVSLVVDNVGDLWLGSQEGLIHAKINRTEPLLTAEFRFFNSGDGLQGDYHNKNAIFLSKKGNVFFGGSDGFNFVEPSSFPFYDAESQVVFSEFQLFNKTVSVNAQINGRILLKGPLDKNRAIQLNHDENIFSVSFSSMNQYSVSEVAYKVGFNNAKYFSKHFKNNYGTLPSQYQKNNHDA